VDSPSRGVQVSTSHPVFKGRVPANDPPPPGPQSQAQKVVVNAPKDVPPAQTVEPTRPAGQTGEPVSMGKRVPRSRPKREDRPPADVVDIDEGQRTRKRPRGEEAPTKELVSTANKVPIRGSGWLNERLPGAADQDLFLKWIEKEHLADHDHLQPYNAFADDMLERWNSTLTKPRQLGPRRTRPFVRR